MTGSTGRPALRVIRWLEEFGEAELIGGWAQVALDRAFAQLIEEDYQVFVSSYDPVQLFIQNRTPQSFEIHVLPTQSRYLRSPAHCAYHIVGRRAVKTTRQTRGEIEVIR